MDFVVTDLKEELFFKALAFLVKSNRFDIDLKPWEKIGRSEQGKSGMRRRNSCMKETRRTTIAEIEKELLSLQALLTELAVVKSQNESPAALPGRVNRRANQSALI